MEELKDLVTENIKTVWETLGSDIGHVYSFDCPPLDISLGGGIASSKIYECFGWESCITEDTLIYTGDGLRPLKDVSVGDHVWSMYNNKKVLNKVLAKKERLTDFELYEVELESGDKLKITGDHKVFTDRGWTKVEDLTLDDNIKEFSDFKSKSNEAMENFLCK